MFERYRIGNAQIIGRKKVQSNYFSTKYNKSGDLLAVLADGTIDHPNGRKAAMLAVEYYIDALSQNLYSGHLNLFALDTAIRANRHIQSLIYIGRIPRLSLSVVLFSKGEIGYFNVGANEIFLYDGDNERIVSDDTRNPNISYSSGRLKVRSKSVIGIMSAGIYAFTHPMERLRIIESKINTFEKAQAMVEVVNNKKLNNQLNATTLLVEVLR